MLKKPDKYFWIANAVLILSLVLFFSRSIFTNRILAPPALEAYPFFVGNPLIDKRSVNYILDPIEQFIPWFHFDRQMLKSGKLPLWDPYQGCGAPHIANMQSSVFFPLNIFVYTLNWKWGLFFLYFFRLYFVGLFLFIYLMEIDVSPDVSMGIAVTGMFIGYILGSLYNIIMNVAFFFPLGLWAIELILKNKRNFKGFLILCLGFTFALLGGHPELAFYSTFTLAIYLLIRLFQVRDFKLYRDHLSLLGKFIILCIIGILISAIQVIPFLQYYLLSSAQLSRNTAGISLLNLPIYAFFLSMLPSFTMNSLTLPSTTPISIVLIGITGIIALRKDKIVQTFMIITAVALLTGFHIPFLYSFITWIPGFNIGQNMYIGLFIPWSLLIISAKTLDNLSSEQIRLSIKIAVVLIVGLLMIFGFFALYKIAGSPISMNPLMIYLSQKGVQYIMYSVIVSIVLIVVTLFILKIPNRRLLIAFMVTFISIQTAIPLLLFKPAVKPEYFYPKNKFFTFLSQQYPPFRVTALSYKNKSTAYDADMNTFYDIEDIRNYDALLVNWYTNLFSYINMSDALNLTNVRYLIEEKDFDVSALQNVLKPIAEYNGCILYKNFSTYDRAFMIYNYAIADSQQQALDLLHAYSGQLNHIAIIFHKDIQGMPPTANTQGTYKIEFLKYSPGYIKLTCTTSQPGLFFISDTYFPGWHAIVDGKASKVMRVDYAFQGLWLTQGTHTIELNYDPASFKYGVLLSIIGIISLVGFYLIAFRKREK